MKNLSVIAIGMVLGACVATQEMPLAPNVVRIDTSARGALWVGSAPNVALKKAAEATLARGYTHFILAEAQTGQGRQYVGSYGSGAATVTPVGGGAVVTGFGYSTPVFAPTSNIGVTVVMFRANDPEARSAFNAAQIVKQFGG